VSAKEETTRRQKINEQRRTSWNSASIVDFAEDTRCTRRRNSPDISTRNQKLSGVKCPEQAALYQETHVNEPITFRKDYAGQ
jgi:hypothetical protein